MPTDRPRATTVQPYPPGTQWTFSARRHDFTQTQELVLAAEPNGASMSDDYQPEDTPAAELWQLWADKYANTDHQRWPDRYRPGEVVIYWSVTRPTYDGVFEGAPHTVMPPPSRDMVEMFGSVPDQEDFLTHYTHPVNAETGEPLNWLRLPVLDRGWNCPPVLERGWNNTVAHKGGFIQEATGWKPSPLQPTMDVVQIGKAAGVYVPSLG